MNLIDQAKILTKKMGLKPQRSKGQNFCVDEEVLDQMVNFSKIKQGGQVLEVGPGFGFLTGRLCEQGAEVTAVELEKPLYLAVRGLERFYKNLKVINQDILDFNPADHFGRLPAVNGRRDYQIVANLPYAITSAFLRQFIANPYGPASMTLLVQKEVAERICATAGQMNLLALSVQLYGQPLIRAVVSKRSFWPQPEVDSAIISISGLSAYAHEKTVPEKVFWQVARSGFSGKRKQIHNNLSNSLHLEASLTSKILAKAGILPQARAQELTLDNWLALSSAYIALAHSKD